MEECSPSDTLLLLLEGEAEVIKGKDAQQLAICGKDSVLGEIGVLLNIPQTVTSVIVDSPYA